MTSPARLAAWLLLYILLLIYSSVVLAPPGSHYVPQDPGSVWHQLLGVTWVEHGSDQRADWMANLTTLIPLGFLTAGIFAAGASATGRAAGVVLAAVFCAALILAVKFAQLYVPPRTVTLNYIVAQGAGAAIGIALFLAYRRRGRDWLARAGGRDWLLLLVLYSAAVLLFFLMPFDFVLSPGDLHQRLQQLPGLLQTAPGEGRGHLMRLLLAGADTVITVPVGVLLAVLLPRRPLGLVLTGGFVLMLGVFALTLFVLSAAASLPALALHMIGIAAGVVLVRWGRHVDPRGPRRWLAPLALPLALPYLALLVLANGLLTPHWRDFAEAQADIDPRLFVPLYLFYIVSKAQAAMSVAVHAAMYAPVGVLAWMRNRNRRYEPWLAAAIAALLALAMETARWLKPGFTPDFNEVAVAACAAGFAVKVLDMLWRALPRR